MLGQQITTGGGEKMAKKLNLGDSKLAFQKPNCQAMLPIEDKNLLEVVHMRREVLGEDKDVIQVEEAEGKITQNLIHEDLENVISNLEAKRHAKKFKHPEGGDDGGLLDVLQKNWQLAVTFLKFQVGKKCRTVDPQGKIGNVGERIVITVTVFNHQ